MEHVYLAKIVLPAQIAHLQVNALQEIAVHILWILIWTWLNLLLSLQHILLLLDLGAMEVLSIVKQLIMLGLVLRSLPTDIACRISLETQAWAIMIPLASKDMHSMIFIQIQTFQFIMHAQLLISFQIKSIQLKWFILYSIL